MVKSSQMRAYGLLALPLAFAGLPLYVFAPKFYADHFAVSLPLMGALLILCRIIDAVQDPLLGYASERWLATPARRFQAIAAGVLGMAGSFFLLFHPLIAGEGAELWFTLTLILTVTCYSVTLINFYALGAALTRDYQQQAALSGWREGFGLAGVLLASVLPVALAAPLGEQAAFDAMSGVLFLLALLALWRLSRLGAAPLPVAAPPPLIASLKGCWGNRPFRALALAYLVNGIAASIPATLVLFYVEDVLGAKDYAGLFLACYFAAGACAMPLWTRAVRSWGKKRSWLLSMALAIVSFGWAYLLGAGDGGWFVLVCILSGAAFGADLSIPPAMLTDTLKIDEGAAQYFGVWAFLAKLSLALASGLGLMLLDALTLPVAYALLPCIFKLAAAAIVWQAVEDQGDTQCKNG